MCYKYYIVGIDNSGTIFSTDISFSKKISSIEDIRKIQKTLCEKRSVSQAIILNYILLRTEKYN